MRQPDLRRKMQPKYPKVQQFTDVHLNRRTLRSRRDATVQSQQTHDSHGYELNCSKRLAVKTERQNLMLQVSSFPTWAPVGNFLNVRDFEKFQKIVARSFDKPASLCSTWPDKLFLAFELTWMTFPCFGQLLRVFILQSPSLFCETWIHVLHLRLLVSMCQTSTLHAEEIFRCLP